MITSFKIANIITHVAFIAVLIIVIFFTFGLKIEHGVVIREINYLLKKILDPISRLYPNIVAQKNDYIATIVIPPDSPETIKEIDDSNNKLKLQTVRYIGILLLIAIIVVLIIAWKFSRLSDGKVLTYKAFLIKILKYNLITLIFVAMIYIGFTYFIGHNFIYIDYNKINSEIITKLIEIRGPENSTPQEIQQVINKL
jgi:hypothetical protein